MTALLALRLPAEKISGEVLSFPIAQSAGI